MGWLDAVCHAFAALSLGGFSAYDASVSQFGSPLIEVLIVFMLLAAMNFATTSWPRAGSLVAYWRDVEARTLLALIAASTVCGDLWLRHLRGLAASLAPRGLQPGVDRHRLRLRQPLDYEQWPIFVPMWMLFLSCFAASSGSTGGGINFSGRWSWSAMRRANCSASCILRRSIRCASAGR